MIFVQYVMVEWFVCLKCCIYGFIFISLHRELKKMHDTSSAIINPFTTFNTNVILSDCFSQDTWHHLC